MPNKALDMNTIDSNSRRNFLRQAGQLSLTGMAAPWLANLAAIGDAAAFSASDYKAIVCVFLLGGNDYANTVVTYDNDSYAKYFAIRAAGSGTSGVVLSQSALAATELKPAQALAGGRKYALHPSMPGLTQLFNSGKAAVQLNVGPLVVPLTRAQYNSPDRQKYPLPPKLFSHNDQQSVWQSSAAEGSTVGWGGRFGDMAMGNNANSLFTCISLSGNNVFLSGNTALQYQCSTNGAIPVKPSTSYFFNQPELKAGFLQMLQKSSSHLLENEYNTVTKRGISAQSSVSSGLASVSLSTVFPTGNNLADQLKTVAKLIGARSSLGAKRQVFMVTMGGFDLHDFLATQHPPLLQKLSSAMKEFDDAMTSLGKGPQVTSFTASDFGRTLTSNGDGSDHGWGSHHFVMGGAVDGGKFLGTAPEIGLTHNQQVGSGRLLPSTSVDQLGAELAAWFGVSASDVKTVLPNARNFDLYKLGLFKS